jgi:hypothetical protein
MPPHIWIGAKVSTEQELKLSRALAEANLPPFRDDDGKPHCTLIYSKYSAELEQKLIPLASYGDNPIIAKHIGWDVFSDSQKNQSILVMRLECKELSARFKQLVELGATVDYEDPKLHMSLAGWVTPRFLDTRSFPLFGKIEFVREESEVEK